MCPRMRTLLEYVTLSCSLALGAISRGCHALVRNSRATHARFKDFTNATCVAPQDDDADCSIDVINDVVIELKPGLARSYPAWTYGFEISGYI